MDIFKFRKWRCGANYIHNPALVPVAISVVARQLLHQKQNNYNVNIARARRRQGANSKVNWKSNLR